MTKNSFLIILFISLISSIKAQPVEYYQSCIVNSQCSNLGNFEDADYQILSIIEEIKRFALLPNYPLKIFKTSKCRWANALMKKSNREEYIIYNQNDFNSITDSMKIWVFRSILSHEFSHILYEDPIRDNYTTMIEEIEADRYSGRILKLMKADISLATYFIEKFGTPNATISHSCKEDRINAIKNGFYDVELIERTESGNNLNYDKFITSDITFSNIDVEIKHFTKTFEKQTLKYKIDIDDSSKYNSNTFVDNSIEYYSYYKIIGENINSLKVQFLSDYKSTNKLTNIKKDIVLINEDENLQLKIVFYDCKEEYSIINDSVKFGSNLLGLKEKAINTNFEWKFNINGITFWVDKIGRVWKTYPKTNYYYIAGYTISN